MKNAFTATLTTLLLLLMVGIVFLSDMGNAAACCYVGCPPDKPNCRACSEVKNGGCGSKKKCDPSACDESPMRNLISAAQSFSNVKQREWEQGEEHDTKAGIEEGAKRLVVDFVGA